MNVDDFFERLVAALERSGVPYMVTGSYASSAHGVPRATTDIDIVIAPTASQLRALIAELPADRYYADELDAVEAVAHRSQFNVIDFVRRQGSALDRAYVEKWVREPDLEEQWRTACALAS